jgi:hypothetical protein
MLATVIRRYWLPLVRDLLALGYRVSDMFTDRLTLAEVVAIVVGAPPISSVRFFLDAGWSREAHLLANMAEGQAGIAKITEPYPRPGLDDRTPDPMDSRFFQTDAYEWDEFDELQRKRYSDAEQRKGHGTTRVRTI